MCDWHVFYLLYLLPSGATAYFYSCFITTTTTCRSTATFSSWKFPFLKVFPPIAIYPFVRLISCRNYDHSLFGSHWRCSIAKCGRLSHANSILVRTIIFTYLLILHFGWRYSPRAPFTAQHLSTCRDNCCEFLMSKHVNDFVLRRPLLLLFRGPVEPPSAVDVSLLLRLQSGTACQKQSVLQHLWRCSESHWRRNCSRDPTLTNLNN